jgi:Tol biopolymer transport system component
VTDEDGESSTPTSVYAGIVPPPTIGKIAFTSNLGGNNDIWLMNSNGTGQVALTTNPASDSSPSFSHDGSRIAFASDRDGNSEIYVMNAAGKFQTRLTNNAGFDTTPVFSPDGSKIVFSSNRDGNYEIYIMNSNGTGQTRLTTNTQDDGQPAFSPDGTKIYFARLASNQSDSHIWSMDLNGANQVALTSGSLVLNGQPNVSPNGQKIVFASVRPLSSFTEPEIFIMDANGANQTRLTTATGYDYEPVFSPDGTKIAFRSERNGNAEIYIMDANGANQQRITFDGAPTSNFAPSWAATPMVAVDIPDDLAGEQGSTLTVPITVSDTTGKGILSYDIRLAYDPAVLHLQTVAYDKSGTLSTGFEVNANEETPGVTTISGFGTVPLTGAGTLLKLKFDVIGTPPTSTALTFESFRFNEGIPFADTLGGQAFVQGTIRGTVQYGTSATPVGVPNVSLSATGSPTTSATTAADGTYRLGGFGPGAYIVTPTKTGDNNGISSFDASLISQYMVGLTTFTNNQIFAGDASGDGTLSSFDAALIAQYVVGLPNNSLTGTWHFLPASRSYASVANMADENYTALLIGEVSGNWATSTTSGLSSLMLTNAKSDSGLEQDKPIRKRTTLVTAALPSLKVGVDQSIVVPVTIKFQGEVPAIQAYQFELVYDPLVLQLQSAPLDLAGTLSSGLASVANGQVPGRLRVAVYGARSITDAGTLINLKFRVVGRAGSSSALSFTNLMFNEGNPKSADHGGKISVRK